MCLGDLYPLSVLLLRLRLRKRQGLHHEWAREHARVPIHGPVLPVPPYGDIPEDALRELQATGGESCDVVGGKTSATIYVVRAL